MTRLQKNAFLFFLIFLQSALAVWLGFFLIYINTRGVISSNVFVGQVELGGLSRDAAINKLEAQLGSAVKDKTLLMQINSQEFNIPYNEVNISIDYKATADEAFGPGQDQVILRLIRGSLLGRKTEVQPKLVLDEKKLREKLEEISKKVGKEPVNANIALKEDTVVKTQEVLGSRLNIDKTVNRIKTELAIHSEGNITIKASPNSEIDVLAPKITLKDLEGADEVVIRYSTEIKSAEWEDSVKLAAYAINKILLHSADIKGGQQADVFSFTKYLTAENGLMEKNNEGYNLVASTLNAAVLTAGIRPDQISRTSHKSPADYIEPGLDAILLGKLVDFRFRNTLDNKIIIFAGVKDKLLSVVIVGKKKDSTVKYGLKVEVDQKYPPAVTQLENPELAVGHKKLVNPGKEGMKVSVFRTTSREGSETSKSLLYEFKYDPIASIVQVGPN